MFQVGVEFEESLAVVIVVLGAYLLDDGHDRTSEETSPMCVDYID